MHDHIPVIDLSAMRASKPAARQMLCREVDAACRGLGFLVVRGSGVDPTVVRRLREQAIEFFALPLADKLMVRRPSNDQNRGYIPYGEETLARMHGGDTPADFKEVFAIGPDAVPDEPYFREPCAYPSFAPNLWPTQPPGLRDAMTAYFAQMEQLMTLLASVFAQSLGLPARYFSEALDKHTSQLRLLHYPAPDAPLETGQLRCGEHTDLGMMTILHNQAAAGGLQVCTPNGAWLDAPAIEDTFIVNLGDLMMRWTNDRWRSTRHRVAVPGVDERNNSARLAIGFFVGPNYDTVVECLPGCASGKDGRALYPPITVHDYRTDRFAAGAGQKRN